MSNLPKDIVKKFYNENFLRDKKALHQYVHPEVRLIWNSTDGLNILQFEDLENLFTEINRTYADLRIEVSHVLQDDVHVTIRYKYYVKTIENPDEELAIAHFMAIWEVKDDKLYSGYQISQPAMEQDDTNGSYHKVKV